MTRAMMLITDSSASSELTCAGSRSYVTDRGGRKISPADSSLSLAVTPASISQYVKNAGTPGGLFGDNKRAGLPQSIAGTDGHGSATGGHLNAKLGLGAE